MPMYFKGKRVAHAYFKSKKVWYPLGSVVYKGDKVFSNGLVTAVIVTWAKQSRPSKKEVPNPDYATWLEGRPPYVTAYSKAKRAYDEWLLREPTKTETNPAYTTWLIDKKPYDDKIKSLEDDIADWKTREPEFESQEWKDWDKEQKRLDGVASEKERYKNEWKAANPEPPAPGKHVNPDWKTWNKELEQLESEEKQLSKSVDDWTSELSSAAAAKEKALTEYGKAKEEYDRAVEAGAPPSVTDPLYTILKNKETAADKAIRRWKDADMALLSAKGSLEAKQKEISTHKSKEPPYWINEEPSEEWKAWNKEWNKVAKAANEAAEEARLHRETEPKKESQDHEGWVAFGELLEKNLSGAKTALNNWLIDNPEPDHTRITQAWKDWDSEKDRLYKVQEQKKKDLADYDSKEPSKTIWVPITLYKYKLSAKLSKNPEPGYLSNDIMAVSLKAGKYNAAVTLSLSSPSGSAVSSYESEDHPDSVTLSATGCGNSFSTTTESSSWTTPEVLFRYTNG